MSIIIIDGPKKSGKSLLANSLRNNAINNGRGALLVDDTQSGETRYLLEKIIDGSPKPFVAGKEIVTLAHTLGERPGQGEAVVTPVDKINWKSDPVVILVGSNAGRLAEFEALVPGFTAQFGPVSRMTLEAA